MLGFFIGLQRQRFESFRIFFDAVLFGLVAGDLGDVFCLLLGIGRQRLGQFGQILLGTLALVVGPLIGSGSFLQHGFVLEIKRLVLRMPALVADDRADGGEDRGEDGDHLREAGASLGVIAVVFGLVLYRMIVRAVYVKF